MKCSYSKIRTQVCWITNLGTVYDIRCVDKIQVNKEYMAKLKKRHKSAWQGWWQQKRENNHSLLLNSKQNNIKEVEKLLEISTKDLKPEINIKDDNGELYLLCRLCTNTLQLS